MRSFAIQGPVTQKHCYPQPSLYYTAEINRIFFSFFQLYFYYIAYLLISTFVEVSLIVLVNRLLGPIFSPVTRVISVIQYLRKTSTITGYHV